MRRVFPALEDGNVAIQYSPDGASWATGGCGATPCQYVRVQVSYTDGLGYDESLHSAPTNPIALPPGINTAPFVVQQQGTLGFLDPLGAPGGTGLQKIGPDRPR